MHSYSQDLRDRILRALDRGERPTDISIRFEVSRDFIYQVKNRRDKEGITHSLQIGGHRQSRIAPMETIIREWIKVEADLTLAALCERLKAYDIVIKVPALWHQLDKWGLSYKKNSARQRARAEGRTGSKA
jgi:transposase